MKKSILALAILSTLSAVAQADDISQALGGNSIDVYQVVDTVNDGANTISLTNELAADAGQINLAIGNTVGGANSIIIDQTGSSAGTIANVVLNATLEDGIAVLNGVGAGDTVTGLIADITTATDGIVGQVTADDTTGNVITIGQAGATDIINLAVAGSTNTIEINQSGATNIANVLIDGTENTVTVSQTTDTAAFSLALHSSGETITVTQ